MKHRTGYKLLAILTIVLLLFTQITVQAFASAENGNAGSDVLRILDRSSRKKNTPAPTPTGTLIPQAGEAAMTPTPVPDGPIIDPQSIADYLFAHGELPDNFITKKEAKALGWGTTYKNVSDAAPGKSIGGDYFGNYEGRLPVEQGVEYHEADCWYTGGKRNAYRVIYSNQGRVWYTEDHYETFTELFPTVPREEDETVNSR